MFFMLHNIYMARGDSGRVVIEMDPELKASLYSVLAKRRTTLKDWFLASAQRFVEEQSQPSLFPESAPGVAEPPQDYVKPSGNKK
jgi:hypothetical protein